jgi:Na+/melibiose symporter-like transporter
MRVSGYLLYTAGQLGIMMLTRYFFQWVIRFTDGSAPGAAGALFSAWLVGLVFFGFRILDGITDPLAGALGDSWVARGRERRGLLWLALPWGPIGLALVFAPTLAMDPSLRWTFLLAGMFTFFAGYTLYAIPYWSLIDDYAAGDVRVRTRLSNAQGVGVLLATGVGFVLSPLAIAKWGFLGGAIAFGCVGGACMALPYFAAPRDLKPATSHGLPPLRALFGALRDRRFVAVIVLFAGAQMSFTVMTAAAPYIAERLLGGKLSDVALLLGPFLLTALLSFSFVPRLAARLGWERFTLLATVVLGVVYAGAGLLGRGLVGSPLTTAMLVFGCAGPAAAVILGIEGEAITRCAVASGKQVTGTYFGVFNLVVKALNGLALSLTGALAELGRDSMGAVRAMPVAAGALCVTGVLLYLALRVPPGQLSASLEAN